MGGWRENKGGYTRGRPKVQLDLGLTPDQAAIAAAESKGGGTVCPQASSLLELDFCGV